MPQPIQLHLRSARSSADRQFRRRLRAGLSGQLPAVSRCVRALSRICESPCTPAARLSNGSTPIIRNISTGWPGMWPAGRIEIIGGAFYEPILAMIPSRDRVGQIRSYQPLARRIGWAPRSAACGFPSGSGNRAWPAIWSPPGSNTRSSTIRISRTPASTPNELHGYFLTEDEGQLLRVFPGSERLRYVIPFAAPHETIDYLRGLSRTASGRGRRVRRRRREIRRLARNEAARFRSRLAAAVFRPAGRRTRTGSR